MPTGELCETLTYIGMINIASVTGRREVNLFSPLRGSCCGHALSTTQPGTRCSALNIARCCASGHVYGWSNSCRCFGLDTDSCFAPYGQIQD